MGEGTWPFKTAGGGERAIRFGERAYRDMDIDRAQTTTIFSPVGEDKSLATRLVSCVIPKRNAFRYFEHSRFILVAALRQIFPRRFSNNLTRIVFDFVPLFLDIITCFGTRDNRLSLPSIFASSETVVDNVVYEQDAGGNLINVELTVSRLLMNDMMDRFQLAHLVIPVQ